jgi:murein DD-endopeptidase MepM/ murein hydrolase activator NlpD
MHEIEKASGPAKRRPTRFTVTVADRTTGAARRATLPLWPTVAAAACMLMLPLLMGLGARWGVHAELEQLRAANASLEMANDSYREATVQLSSQVAALQAAVDDIGERASVDPAASRAMERLPAAVRSRAMGGSAADAVAPALGTALGHADTAFGVLSDILSVIERRLDSVRSGVERRQALASATPSIWPVPGWLSSAYGNRRDPFSGDASFHPGLDISAGHGQPVVATADGTVTTAANSGNYGNLVVIDHGFGLGTRYGHLSRFAVMQGQRVSRGDVIGYVGSTGRSTSSHLHYEVWVNDRLTNPLRLLGPR